MTNRDVVEYKDMTKILKDMDCGSASIEHFIITKDNFRAIIHDGIPTGLYVRLMINGEVMMSDTPMEKKTNQDFINEAHGRVLIGGLGLGLILLPVMEKESVSEIVVVEYNQDVIDLVEPQLNLSDKVKIVHDDVFEYVPEGVFNTIYMDIWPYVNSEIYDEEMTPLLEYYKNFIDTGDEDAFLHCWCEVQAENDLRLTEVL